MRNTTSLLHGKDERKISTHRLCQRRMLPPYYREKLKNRILFTVLVAKVFNGAGGDRSIIFKLLTVVTVAQLAGTLKNK